MRLMSPGWALGKGDALGPQPLRQLHLVRSPGPTWSVHPGHQVHLLLIQWTAGAPARRLCGVRGVRLAGLRPKVLRLSRRGAQILTISRARRSTSLGTHLPSGRQGHGRRRRRPRAMAPRGPWRLLIRRISAHPGTPPRTPQRADVARRGGSPAENPRNPLNRLSSRPDFSGLAPVFFFTLNKFV